MRANKTISWLTAMLVIFLAGSAFILSFNNLQALAASHGIAGWLSYLWPLTLDAFMVAAGISVLWGGINRKTFGQLWYPWLLVGAFTALSIGFNIVNAPTTVLARAIFALPPLVVFLALELLTSQVSESLHVEPELTNLVVLPTNSIGRLLAFYSEQPMASHSEAARAVGENRQWVTAKLKQLEADGRLRRDGDGVEVADDALYFIRGELMDEAPEM